MGKKKKQEKQKQKKKKLQEITELQKTGDPGEIEYPKKKTAGDRKDPAEKVRTDRKDPEEKVRTDRKDPEEIVRADRPDLETMEKAAAVFRAFGDETRLQILQILEGKELCNSELLQYVSVVQSTLSHHMRVLTDAGVVKCRRYGKFAYYSICPDRFACAVEYLKYYQMISSLPITKKEKE